MTKHHDPGTATEPAQTGEWEREGLRVVVGFDDSEHALRALDVAAAEAARRGAALEVVCGWPWGDTISSAAGGHLDAADRVLTVLEGVAARVRANYPQMSVTPTVTADPAAEALLRCSREAALTVVGTRGHGGFAGLLLGSVSLRVAAHTAGPLLVVGPAQVTGLRDGRSRVLVAMKTDGDRDALEFGFAEAERRGAALTILHAWQFSPYPDDVQNTAAATTLISATVQEARKKFPSVDASVDSIQDRPAKALVEESASADVVVLGAHRRKHRFGLHLGPVTHAVLSHARCPVALVPARS